MDWMIATDALLSTPPVPTCPALSAALSAIEAGQLETAAAALVDLNEDQRPLATFLVEIAAAARPEVDDDALDTLCQALHALPANTVDLSKLPDRLTHAWAEAVAPRLAPATVARRDAFGHGQHLLGQAIEMLCAEGAAPRALAYAALLDPHHREEVAQAWVQIGLSLPADHAERDAALMQAAQAGNARPMIQDGGEEASAHGVALNAMARGGIAADHPAVTTSLKGLTKLGKHRARKDVRSFGVATACIGAASRVVDTGDAAWLAIAEQLLALIWDEGPLRNRAEAACALARQAPDLPADYPPIDGPQRDPYADLVRRRAAGEDVADAIEAALTAWDGNGLKAATLFVQGCRLDLDDARLATLLADVRPKDRPEALVEAAHYAVAASDARRAGWLNQGYPEGDRFGIFSADVLHLLSPARQMAGELYYAAEGITRALAHLVGLHMQAGRLDDAARVIARMGQPRVKEPWTPSYRRGSRGERPLPGQPPQLGGPPVATTAETVKAQLKATKTGFALLAPAGRSGAQVRCRPADADRASDQGALPAAPAMAGLRAPVSGAGGHAGTVGGARSGSGLHREGHEAALSVYG